MAIRNTWRMPNKIWMWWEKSFVFFYKNKHVLPTALGSAVVPRKYYGPINGPVPICCFTFCQKEIKSIAQLKLFNTSKSMLYNYYRYLTENEIKNNPSIYLLIWFWFVFLHYSAQSMWNMPRYFHWRRYLAWKYPRNGIDVLSVYWRLFAVWPWP